MSLPSVDRVAGSKSRAQWIFLTLWPATVHESCPVARLQGLPASSDSLRPNNSSRRGTHPKQPSGGWAARRHSSSLCAAGTGHPAAPGNAPAAGRWGAMNTAAVGRGQVHLAPRSALLPGQSTPMRPGVCASWKGGVRLRPLRAGPTQRATPLCLRGLPRLLCMVGLGRASLLTSLPLSEQNFSLNPAEPCPARPRTELSGVSSSAGMTWVSSGAKINTWVG